MQFTTKAEAARALGINRNTFSGWCQRDIPGGADGPWQLAAIVPWLLTRQAKRQPLDDPLLDCAADSPALERYRTARAEMSELELARQKGELLVSADLRDWMGRAASHLRRAGERLGKQHGTEAQAILNSAIDEFQGIVDAELKGPRHA